MGWLDKATPRPLYPREKPGTHCIGGWVELRVGLGGYGKFLLPLPPREPNTRPVLINSLE
jgi:hypothetical protein